MSPPRPPASALAAAILAIALNALAGAVPATSASVEIEAVASFHRFHGHVVDPGVVADLDATGRPVRGRFACRWSQVTTDHRERDAEMLTWSESAREPDIVFELDSLEGDDAAPILVGRLRLHGQEHPLRLPARLSRGPSGTRLEGDVVLDHREFGLPQFRKFGVLTVNPVVRLHWTAEFPVVAAAANPEPVAP